MCRIKADTEVGGEGGIGQLGDFLNDLDSLWGSFGVATRFGLEGELDAFARFLMEDVEVLKSLNHVLIGWREILMKSFKRERCSREASFCDVWWHQSSQCASGLGGIERTLWVAPRGVVDSSFYGCLMKRTVGESIECERDEVVLGAEGLNLFLGGR